MTQVLRRRAASRTARGWCAGAFTLAAASAGAQSIEQIVLRTQGEETIASVQFDAPVRAFPQAPDGAVALARVAFERVTADRASTTPPAVQTKTVNAAGPMPAFTLSFEPVPGQSRQQMTLQFRAPIALQVRQGPSPRAIDLVFHAPAPLAPASDRRYALRLQVLPLAQADQMVPIPSQLQSYDVFSLSTELGGAPALAVHVGYFATEAEAREALQIAQRRFPQAEIIDVPQRREQVLEAAAQSAAQTAPAPAAPTAPASAPAPAPQPPAVTAEALSEIDRQGEDLLARAKTALVGKRYEDAINLLNQLLLLPPNRSSQDAQEIAGLAWERAGDTARARTEYQLYLRLFPEGEGADRVRQRIAALTESAPAPLAAEGSRPAEPPKKLSGNIAQYYYGGKAKSQSLVNLSAGVDQATLTKTTESAIVTSVDLGGRFDTPEAETRVVLRGTGSTNLAASSHNSSLLSAAYVDYKRTGSGLAVRLGRQSPIGGGLLGLFDGVSLTVPAGQKFKFDLMGGVPANPLVSGPSRRLLAGMVEADGLLDRWGGDLYLIDETTEGVSNRRSLGAEVRYADERGSMYSLLDYDTNFRKLNAVSLQGSFQGPANTTITLLADVRKAPSLELTNALISAGLTSLKTLLQQQTLAETQDQALATSATARQGLLSVSKPLSERWQLAVDLRYSEVGALPAVGNFDATPATGAQYALSAQLTGTNLYSPHDINSFNLSALSSPQFNGTQLAYNNLTGFLDNTLTLEPSIRLYSQSDAQGLKLLRVSPGLRSSYKVSRRASVLGEGLVEHSKTDSPTGHSTTTSLFFYVGYRYELF